MGAIHPKAAAGGPAAMIVVVLGWLLSYAHVTIPADVQVALAGLIAMGIAYYLPSPTAPAPEKAADADSPLPHP